MTQNLRFRIVTRSWDALFFRGAVRVLNSYSSVNEVSSTRQLLVIFAALCLTLIVGVPDAKAAFIVSFRTSVPDPMVAGEVDLSTCLFVAIRTWRIAGGLSGRPDDHLAANYLVQSVA